MADCPKGVSECSCADFCNPEDPYCDKTKKAKSTTTKKPRRRSWLNFGTHHQPKTGSIRMGGIVGGVVDSSTGAHKGTRKNPTETLAEKHLDQENE